MRARLRIFLFLFLFLPSALPQEPTFELDDRVALEAEASGNDDAALAFYLKRLEECAGALTTGDAESIRQARVLAEVYLARAQALARLSGAKELVASLERIAALPLPPEFAAQVDWALLNQFLRLDRVKDAHALGDRLGFLREWRVIGPFDNEAGRGFLTSYPPETDPDLAASFDGDVRKVSWRAIRAGDATGYVNLDAHLRPNDEVLAYALAFVHVDAATPAILRIASDEGARVWLNGETVLSNDVQRAAGFDQERVPVVLAPGWNRLLVKVAEAKGEWGFRLRFTDPQGAPLAGLTASDRLPEGQTLAGKLPPGAPAPPAPPEGAMQILERAVKEHPEDPRRHFHLAILREAAHAEDKVKRSEPQLFRNAVTGDDRNPHYHFFLALALKDEGASTPEREENRIRQELEAALQRFPKHAAAARELAWYYSRALADIHEALGFADLACRINPDSPASRLLLLELLKAGDLNAPMEAEYRDIKQRFPEHPLVLARVAQRAFEQQDYAGAEALFRKSLAADGLNPVARIGLAEALLHEGRMDEARAQYDVFLTLDPYALAAYLQKARIDEARGRWKEAADETRQALAICPEEEALLARLGTQEMMAGRADEGLRLLKEALRLNPNSPQIREYVAALAGSEQSFEKVHRVDPATVLAGRPKGLLPPGKGAVCLLQNTVVRVSRDGTQARYEQRFFHITSAEGVRDFDVLTIPNVAGEQKLTVLTARVHHPDGTADDARLESTAGGGGEGRQWRRFPIDLPVLNVGDVIEVEHLLEDLQPSFFGDYFGDAVHFALPYEAADFRYTLLVPAERPIYFHPVHLAVQPEQEKSPDGRWTIYRWRARDLPGIEPEPDMPELDEVVPTLEISTFADWQAFATWYWGLIKNQHDADDTIRALVRKLTEDKPDEMDRIRRIHDYVTNGVRYVAWEFGVHGYQPYAATQIFHRGFGDCKDKALLMNVMLAEAGIRSRPVLISAEEKRSQRELPFPLIERFNHCISQATLANGERVFLDGTATFHGPNLLPAMDQGASVLVIDDRGGTIQHTPLGTPADNLREEDLELRVDARGPAQVLGRVTVTGPRAAEVRARYWVTEKRDQVLEHDLTATYGEVHVKKKSEFVAMQRLEQPLLFQYEVTVTGFAGERAGGKLAFRPTGTLHRLSDSCTLGERKFDLLLEVPWRDVEKLRIELPRGTRVASLPESKTLEAPFGRFQATVAYAAETNRLTIEKELEIRVTRIAPADYGAYRAFCNAVDAWEGGEALLEK